MAANESIKLAGSGAGVGTMEHMAAEYSRRVPGNTVTVIRNMGSNGGIKALAAGVVDLAVSTRPLTPAEEALGLSAVVYGRTPFVLITARQDAPGLKSFSDFAEMMAGRRTWPDGAPVRVVLQHRQDSDTLLLESLSAQMKQAVQDALARPGAYVAPSDQAAADAVTNTPGAVGTSTMALVLTDRRRLKMLSINGVSPSPQAVSDGSYPYAKSVYLISRRVRTEAVQRFLDFVASPEGRQILIASGHAVADQPAKR